MDYLEDHNTVHCTISDDENVPSKNVLTLRSRAASGPQILERQQGLLFAESKSLPIAMPNEKLPTVNNESSLVEEGAIPLDIADFECSLCFRLFCKPVTTPCGHTYCKNCLLASLKFSAMCPLCRTELHNPCKYKYNANIVLMNVLDKHFKEQYQIREKEDEKEEEESLANNNDNDKEIAEDYYSAWTSCLIPSMRETCCVLLSCT